MNEELKHHGYRFYPSYLPSAETERLLALVTAEPDPFHAVAAKAGLNLAYNVLDGHRIRDDYPDLFELASKRLLAETQELVDEPIELMRDPRRSIRIQCYRAKDQGFKWHVDGGCYSALLTLVNTNRGATEMISPRASRYLKPAPFLTFLFQDALQLARPRKVVADPGDLLIIHGSASIHRGTSVLDDGERMVLVATFDPVGKKPRPIYEWLATRLNY